MPLSPRTLRPSSSFTPRSIPGLALWLDASAAGDLYTTDAGPVTAVTAPTDISGCALWLDASDTSTITQSGGLVSQWNDKSGNNRHATASATARPTSGTRTVNGLNALDFDGTANVVQLTGTAIPTAATHSVFLVYRLDSVSQSRSSTFLASNPASDQEIRVEGFGSTAVHFFYNGNAGRYAYSTALGLGPVVYSAREATGSIRSAGAGVFSSGSGAATAWVTANMTIGGRAAANFMDGLLCEVVIFSTTLSDADTARVEAYLAQRWGISGVHAPASAASDPVGYWRDRSGNSRHATQATGASRPAVSASKQGGRTAVAFPSLTTSVTSPATVAQYVADATTSPKMFFAWVARPEGVGAGIVFGTAPTNPNASSRVFYASDYGAFGTHIVDFGSIGGARLISTVGDEANNVGHVYSTYRDGPVVSVRRDGVEILRKTNASGAYTATTGTLSLNIAEAGSGTASWMEFMAYAASMPSTNIARLERYLAAKWGIVLAPQVSNADAQDWINRVYANGGTVSASTASAVNQFAESVASAGLRDRFYRLNLFCGTGLNACLTPLYRGPSLGGTQYGNTTDTNNGPFVSGDYVESAGLTGTGNNGIGAGNTKHLRTGLTPSMVGVSSGHISAFVFGLNQTAPNQSGIIAIRDNANSQRWWLEYRQSATVAEYTGNNFVTFANPASSTNSHILLSRTSLSSMRYFLNGSQVGAEFTTSVSGTAGTNDWPVFATMTDGVINGYAPFRMGGYSIGLGMTVPQAAAYNTAMQAFQTALGRNV